jgi:dienelactone hydrolase
MKNIKKAIALFALLVGCSASAEPLDTLSAGQSGRIEFMSSTPQNRWTLARSRQTFDNTSENPLVIWGDLIMPPGRVAGTKVPAVIVSHGSEGVSSLYYDVWAKAFLPAGYAVFIVDSQKPRGVQRNLGDLQLTWNTMANISDGLHALKLLATHPDIDSNRIFHIGFSRGAAASYASAWPIYQRPILPDGVRYAGNIAVYPGCNNRYHEELTATNSSPILMLLGEKDDMTPAKPCVEYAEQLAKGGHRVSYKVYPGAYHVFDRIDQKWRTVKEGTFADCSIEHTVTDKRGLPPAIWGDYKTGERFTTDAQYQAAHKACSKVKWISVESNPAAREAAVRDTLDFMAKIPSQQATK